MTVLPHITIYISGLDPLSVLTPMDGLIRSLRRLNWPMKIVGLSTNTHHSGNILSEMFDQVIVFKSQGEQRFYELIQRTADVKGPKLLIPTSTKESLELASHRLWLSKNGFSCPGPSPAQVSKNEYETIQYLAEHLTEIVKWTPIESPSQIDPSITQFPAKVVTSDRSSRWVISNLEMLRVVAGRCLEKGQKPMVRPLMKETVYQVATVIDTEWKPAGWSMVREIAPNRSVEPWMFLSVNSEKLKEKAEIVASKLEYQGPLTMRFIFSDNSKSYRLDSFAPIFPVWTDLAAHCGVNLPGRLMENVLQLPITRSPFVAVPGQMITFNSFDISLPSDAWLNMAGRGGF